jgi:hypothetical protein
MAAAARRRGFQFKATEINDFLALVEEYMPVSAQLWQLVADLHAEKYNKEKRTAESLRRKFQEVCRRTGPTVDLKVERQDKTAILDGNIKSSVYKLFVLLTKKHCSAALYNGKHITKGVCHMLEDLVLF